MVVIYHHCIDTTKTDETFVSDSLNELAQTLRKKIKLPVSIKSLGDEPDLEKELNVILHKLTNPSYTFNHCVNDTFALFVYLSVFEKTCPAQLLVYCPQDSNLSKAAQREKDSAKWGATAGVGGFLPHECKSRIDSKDLSFMYKNFLCAVYPPKDQTKRKFTIWHEALHLLGLDECYDAKTLRRNCMCETCVMQYKPPQGVSENWPSPLCDNLCHKNITQLQNLATKVEQKLKCKKDS